MSSSDRLTEELRRRAEGLTDQHPLTLEDVQTRARGIRRRRHAVSGLAAAAVLAVTVPLGIAAGDRLDRTSAGPVDRPGEGRSLSEDPTPDSTPDPSPAPVLPRRIALTADVEEATASPNLAYLAGDSIHLPDGSTVEVQDDYDTLLPLAGGFVVGGDAGNGDRTTGYLGASGAVVWTERSAGQPVASPSGRLAAYGRLDGTTVTVGEDGRRRPLTTAAGNGYLVVAVLGDAGTCGGTGGDCTVWSNSPTTLEAVAQRTTDAGGDAGSAGSETTGVLPALVEAVSVTGRLALTVSADGTGGLCSAVDEPDATRLWRTCDWRLGQFSHDGRFVLGYPLEDGRGPRSVALLDARTGEVVREYAAQGREEVFVRQAVWDADGSVLATVWDTDRWAVLRMGLDGSLTSVPAEGLDAAADPDAPPVFLAAAPSPS